MKEYDLVIDTNLYAGNFEREMCGYVTGVWDEDTHGGDQAAVFHQEVSGDPFAEIVELRPDDDHGWMKPEAIAQTPPKFHNHNSVAIHLSEVPPENLIELIKSRAHKFAAEGKVFDRPVEGLKILGFRLLEQTTTTTEREIA